MAGRVKIHPPERLKDKHDITQFDCGDRSMNRWLKKIARKADKDTSAVFVVREGGRVIGYYATAMGAVPMVSAGKLGEKSSPAQIPVFVLARLAVDNAYKGRGLGKDMIADAFKRAVRASQHAGMRAVVVHTLDDGLVEYYASLGFSQLEPGGRTMFIPLETIVASL